MLAVLVAAAGCGGDRPRGWHARGSRPLSDRLVDLSKDPPYVNALDVDPATGDYLMTTNRGFWRIDPQTDPSSSLTGTVTADGGSSPVGTFLEVLVTGRERCSARGIPTAEGAAALPRPDLVRRRRRHVGGDLAPRRSRPAQDPAQARSHVRDRRRAWGRPRLGRRRPDFAEHFTPRDEVFIDLEVDPGDPDHVVGATETELFGSQDAGKTWRPLDTRGIRLVWTAPDAFFRADRDGTIYRRATAAFLRGGRHGAGRAVQVQGARHRHLLLALSDGTVVETTDGGKSGRRRSGHETAALPRRGGRAARPGDRLAHSLVRIGGDVSATNRRRDLPELAGRPPRRRPHRLRDRTVDGGIDPGTVRVGEITSRPSSSRPSARARAWTCSPRPRRARGQRDVDCRSLSCSSAVRARPPAYDRVCRPDARRRRQRQLGSGPGNDVVDGGLGFDVLDGGDGDDLLATPTDSPTGSSVVRAPTRRGRHDGRRRGGLRSVSRSGRPAARRPATTPSRRSSARRADAAAARPRARPPAGHDAASAARWPPRAPSTSPGSRCRSRPTASGSPSPAGASG